MPPLCPPSLSPPRPAPAPRQLCACVGLSLYPEAALTDLLLGLPLALLGAHEEDPRPLEWRSPCHTSAPSPGSFVAEGHPLAPGPKVQGKAAPLLPPPLSAPPLLSPQFSHPPTPPGYGHSPTLPCLTGPYTFSSRMAVVRTPGVAAPHLC